MIGNDTIQTLRKIVAEMGRDSVCLNPNSFAGAILDICDADDVKLLTNSLRAYYSGKLMDFFRNGSSDAATWAQQKRKRGDRARRALAGHGLASAEDGIFLTEAGA